MTAVPVSWGGKPLSGFRQETPVPAAAGLWLSGLTSGFVLTVPLGPPSMWFEANKLCSGVLVVILLPPSSEK